MRRDARFPGSPDPRRRPARRTAFLIGASAAAGWIAFGPISLGILLPAALLYVVARYDNHSGSCLMITILGLIVLAVLTLLMVLLAMMGASH